ncbi:hypothetical protein N0B51_11635 [Tsuneonella sp. YG55]|uniref:Uncharacterized protein n=1 Tax=Tsuneonella litorea TaxID=2976475 RepID=A0A9X2W4Q4_9SPHN|nr:hypothetical protein [Tsuneonella litorea]MCT2559631.1 hypothetical protein [Tsuneonella litorea]
MKLIDGLRFASDAEVLSLWGAGFAVLAVVCLVMERRRMKRAAINRVGWVPWTGLFLVCVVVAGGLLALGVPSWLRGA